MKLALEEAFENAQQELIQFSNSQNVNLDVSGSTGTVLIRHEQNVHIAWIGDACEGKILDVRFPCIIDKIKASNDNFLALTLALLKSKFPTSQVAMVASWNRHDSREIFTTTAHVPELPAEKERIEACGSEVREVAPECFRIYLKGQDVPGLTMSRVRRGLITISL
jgi:hypothetical protein